MPPLSLYDSRHGDTYVIYLDDDLSFSYVLRYVNGCGREAITYNYLADIPQPYQDEIENLISKKKQYV